MIQAKEATVTTAKVIATAYCKPDNKYVYMTASNFFRSSDFSTQLEKSIFRQPSCFFNSFTERLLISSSENCSCFTSAYSFATSFASALGLLAGDFFSSVLLSEVVS